ncbi:amidohydrolase family protein [Nakamurella sp. YIM 132087]|uniref:Amidohydrolase family protein n=1 Tax=Nakamurella alba TaxID=2665158 RepID=A0A7K1FNM5_9ACTN|nr:amidohydrolase family protein [Nakamurella alba]MTD15765.1 amidohydrolase family protein [Nakamurella alba]
MPDDLEQTENTCDLLLRGTVLTVDPERRVLTDGWVAIRAGIIVGVGSGESPFVAAETAGSAGHLIMPGLVNTHTHLVQGCIRSMAEGTRFEERLFGFYYPMTGAAGQQDSYWSAMTPVLDLLRSGVTTTADDHFTHVDTRSMDGVLGALTDAGLRARAARLTVNDENAVPPGMRESVDVGLAETDRLAAEWNSPTLSVTATSIGITYVTPDDLHRLYDWTVAHGEQFDIHVPSMMDKKYLAEKRGWHGGSIEWLAKEDMLGPNTIAIHAQGIREGEAQLMADAGAAVSLVPDMELVLGMVTFDSRAYQAAGVTIGLGLDGPVVAYGHNMWLALRGYLMAQRIGDSARKLVGGDAGRFGDEILFGIAEKAIELGTLGGAQALGLADRIGSVEVGKDADLLLIDLGNATTLAPSGMLLANLVWAGGPGPDVIERVLVRGRTVMRNGVSTAIDHREAVTKANEVQSRLLTATGSDRFLGRGSTWRW